MRYFILLSTILAAAASSAELVIDITGSGAEKRLVSIDVRGDQQFAKTLERNLVLSGAFKVVKNGSIKVEGEVGSDIVVKGEHQRLRLPPTETDSKSLRREARRLADTMCLKYANQKGFASDPIAFVMKKGKSEELCVGYADGGDIRQLTESGRAAVGPRWKGSDTILYTGYLNNAPQIFEISPATGATKMKWGFGGLTAGATVSPNGNDVAIILSKQFGNPELCVIDMGSGKWRRLTNTRAANEGQPAWSPDGSKLVYVSDESRRQHLYIMDAQTKSKRRVTSSGSQNVDPDWGPDGRIAYTTRRGGINHIAVMNSAEGDSSARLVTEPGAWEHPSWARDGRHLVAERDGELFLIDAMENGADVPKRLFRVGGRCITPSWQR